PKYSPDLNPIEQVFAKLKGLLRKLAPRSLPDLERAIAEALTQFSPEECENYLRHAGYAT
ncbi:MAG: transposase, partial [Pseudomonadota bacterium]|nr:transposase [Pseudomonadota bacterium]